MGREVTQQSSEATSLPPFPAPRPVGATGCCCPWYRVFVFNLYLLLPCPPPARPHPCSSQLPRQCQCTSPAAHTPLACSQASAPPLGGPRRVPLRVSGVGTLGDNPTAPPLRTHPLGRWGATLPLFSHRLWEPKGRKGRNQIRTPKKGEVGKEGGDGETQQAWDGDDRRAWEGEEGRRDGGREENRGK